MSDLFYFTGLLNVLILPILAGTSLVLAKLCQGEAARQAERWFLATLVMMTISTIRTVANSDEVWLVHTATLATMIVGSLVIPSQQTPVAVS